MSQAQQIELPSGSKHNVQVGHLGSTRSYSDRQRALKWVLPTTLRVYGLRPSGKTKGSTAPFLLGSLSTNCVLLESHPANGLRPSFAQAGCKECAALRQAA